MMVRADEEDVRLALAGRAPERVTADARWCSARAACWAGARRAAARPRAGAGGGGRARRMRHQRRGRRARAVQAARPDVVFNAAAYTDVDRAESEPAAADAVNAAGAENVARAAAAAGAKLVHYSTDFVFDGELERPYDEDDPPSPQGRYAASRRPATRAWRRRAERHFILRVGCLYGRGGRNFPSTIVRRLRAGETIRADNDRLGSPTWAREVARRVGGAGAHRTSRPLPLHRPGRDHLGRLRPPGGRHAGRAGRTASGACRRPSCRSRRNARAARSSTTAACASTASTALSTWQDALRAFIAEETGLGQGRWSVARKNRRVLEPRRRAILRRQQGLRSRAT